MSLTRSLEPLSPVDVIVPAVFLRVPIQLKSAVSAIEIYERSRGDWVMRPSRHPHVAHAVIVSRGIVREVYRIREWMEIDIRVEPSNPYRLSGRAERPSVNAYRWRFEGMPDQELRQLYVGRSIFLPGSNPVTWQDDVATTFPESSPPIIRALSR